MARVVFATKAMKICIATTNFPRWKGDHRAPFIFELARALKEEGHAIRVATLHTPVVSTPGELRGSSWRRTRLSSAGYALGWRAYNYAGHDLVFHGGAVQGYRGAMALLPDRDLGIAILWNSESALPSGLLPTIIDSALGLSGGQWLDEEVAAPEPTMYANQRGTPAGVEASASTASPE